MRKLLRMLAAVVLRQRGGPNGAQVGHMHGGTININNHSQSVDARVEAERAELLSLMGKMRRGGQRDRLQAWMNKKFGTAYVKDLRPGDVGLALRYARAMRENKSRPSQHGDL